MPIPIQGSASDGRGSPPSAPVEWPAGIEPTADWIAAIDYIRTGEGHIFITGRAGSGKSTLLRMLPDIVSDEMAVVAPTGLAAVNVGGQTIHSFFGLPPRLIRSDDNPLQIGVRPTEGRSAILGENPNTPFGIGDETADLEK